MGLNGAAEKNLRALVPDKPGRKLQLLSITAVTSLNSVSSSWKHRLVYCWVVVKVKDILSLLVSGFTFTLNVMPPWLFFLNPWILEEAIDWVMFLFYSLRPVYPSLFHFSLFSLVNFLIRLESRLFKVPSLEAGKLLREISLVYTQLHCFLPVWPCSSYLPCLSLDLLIS